MQLTRRSLFSAALVPLTLPQIAKSAISIPVVAAPKPEDCTVWIHYEHEDARVNCLETDYFQSLKDFVKQHTGKQWLTCRSQYDEPVSERERQAAIEGSTIITTIWKYNPLSSYPIIKTANLITQKRFNGPVEFLQCPWTDHKIATAKFNSGIWSNG